MPTTAQVNRAARDIMRMFGDTTEVVTYRSRTTASATPVDHTGLTVHLEALSEHAIAMHALATNDRPTVLRQDQIARIPVASVSWTPTLFDELLRTDGTHWRVISGVDAGGPGDPFYRLQCRKIPS